MDLQSRKAWLEMLAAADAEKNEEIAVKDAQIEELKEHLVSLDSSLAEELEREEWQAEQLVDLQSRKAELQKLAGAGSAKDAEIAAKDLSLTLQAKETYCRAVSFQQEFLLESEKKLEEGRLQEKLARAGNDAAARQKLLPDHELKLAALEAPKAMEKDKADDELQKKLEERRNKKKKVQEQLHQQQIETVAKTSADGVAKELDELQREGMLMVRQEEDAAQAAFDLVEEAQAASAILTQELAERVELECGSEEARFQELLRNGNLSAQ